MNAKIKELIEQATEQVSQPEGTYGLISDYVFKFNKEKFAELIVRECLDEVIFNSDYFSSDKMQQQLVSKIKQRFGIEK